MYYRFHLTGERPWQTGAYYAVHDLDSAPNTIRTGAVQDLYPAEPDMYLPFATGQWNRVSIIVQGDSDQHWLNGKRVAGFRYGSVDFFQRVDKSKYAREPGFCAPVPGLRDLNKYTAEGYLGFQASWGGQWSLRNLRITETAMLDSPKNCPDQSATRRAETPGMPAIRGLRRAAGGAVARLSASEGVTGVVLAFLDGRSVLAAAGMQGDEAAFTGILRSGAYIGTVSSKSRASSRILILP